MPDTIPPRWSVVIPAYNEAQRLPAYLSEVVAYFDGRGEPYEVIVVDDGSADETAARVLEAQAIHQAVTLHRLAENRGKGFAVRAGMRAARGGLRLMADADGATPIAEIKRLETVIQAGADLAVGSRALPDPSVRREVQIHRKLSGEIFNFFARRMGVGDVTDTQCGFKLFRGAVAEALFGELETTGFGFDVELLMLARRRGYRVVEVAINWADQPGSKVDVLRDGPRMLAQIVRARVRLARRGRARL
ncbi:MAG TPA: dolichyl-phosphate beta-glucosyltransferase [Methylomirabilota bacterium]